MIDMAQTTLKVTVLETVQVEKEISLIVDEELISTQDLMSLLSEVSLDDEFANGIELIDSVERMISSEARLTISDCETVDERQFVELLDTRVE